MSAQQDSVELEYERAITAATQRGDDAWASELAVGLDQYRTLYKATGAQATARLVDGEPNG